MLMERQTEVVMESLRMTLQMRKVTKQVKSLMKRMKTERG
uniref:Uncharacterized protein n=1 Tax=Anguilla anguilla TaxID=7936 RepID=A0A0E9RAH7_ANGAN